MLKKMILVASLGVIAVTQAQAQNNNVQQESTTKSTYANGKSFPPTLTISTSFSGYNGNGVRKVSTSAEVRDSMLLTEKVVTANNYRLKNGGFRYLPTDIADIELPMTLKEGYLTQQQLLDKKDRLSVFLSQDPNTAKNVGLYKQRVLGWYEGKVPYGTTIETANLTEAYFDFLSLPVSQANMNDAKMNYFANRLSLRDFEILQSWLVSQDDPTIEKPLVDVISETLVDYRINQ